ncbi:MAG: heavy-metal-associated domain-containing protein [Flavobacteriales bacterium]
MFKPSLLIAVVVLAVACSGSDSATTTSVASRTENIVSISEGSPMATADLGISGMTCEMMCGGMIKSALVKVPGVETTEIAFHDGDVIGHAKVTYDPAKVDDSKFVETVQALADGQYKVESIAVVKQVKGEKQAQSKKHDQVQGNGTSVSIIPEVPMPSLVAMLLALVRA